MQAKGKGLEERTARFAARVVNVCEAVPAGLRIVGASGYLPQERLAPLIEESSELTRMMGASVSTARSRMEPSME